MAADGSDAEWRAAACAAPHCPAKAGLGTETLRAEQGRGELGAWGT